MLTHCIYRHLHFYITAFIKLIYNILVSLALYLVPVAFQLKVDVNSAM